MRWGQWLVAMLVAGTLAGCSSTPPSSSSSSSTAGQSSSRYSMDKDTGPDSHVDVSNVPDAVPRAEPPSRYGNKSPYQVWGKTYYVLDDATGYREDGNASWYGRKFHGHRTSNGETYDMYEMSAAHKTLPLPSYVRVTNLGNGRSVVVRVNDRGPFHSERIIDLSYAAAVKLGYANQGTAKVRVEAITVPNTAAAPVSAPASGGVERGMGYFVQVGAFSNPEGAQRLRGQLTPHAQATVSVVNAAENGVALHRVRMGPFFDEAAARRQLAALPSSFGQPLVVLRPLPFSP